MVGRDPKAPLRQLRQEEPQRYDPNLVSTPYVPGYYRENPTVPSAAFWVPGLPHILKPQHHEAHRSLNEAMAIVGEEIRALEPQRILYYSTQWISVLGHSLQAKSRVQGTHVDENWHDLVDLPFSFQVDQSYAKSIGEQLSKHDYQVRLVDYEGFPVDTGTIVANQLVNPDNIPCAMLSCCVYSDYNDTKRIGELIAQVAGAEGTAVVVVSGLSQHFFTEPVDLREDYVRFDRDDQLNRAFLNRLSAGLHDEAEETLPSVGKEIKADMGFKAYGFLRGLGYAKEGQKAELMAYGPVYGTGAAVMKVF